MPKVLKIVFTFKFHPLHAKISTPTGTPVPDEKVKELSSDDINPCFMTFEIKNHWMPLIYLPDKENKIHICHA